MCTTHENAVNGDVGQSSSDWRDRGWYKVKGNCCVCGSDHQIGMEPRFGYVVCEAHAELPPTEISQLRKF